MSIENDRMKAEIEVGEAELDAFERHMHFIRREKRNEMAERFMHDLVQANAADLFRGDDIDLITPMAKIAFALADAMFDEATKD